MVKRNYLGPSHECSMKLRRAYLDLRVELGSCRPLGPEYKAVEAVLGQINETHRLLFKTPCATSLPAHETGPGPEGVQRW